MLGSRRGRQDDNHGFLDGEDCLATRAALESMGVHYQNAICRTAGSRSTESVCTGLQAPLAALDLGNSGTGDSPDDRAARRVKRSTAELTGDASLRQRPMERIAAPLRAMGARIELATASRRFASAAAARSRHRVHLADRKRPGEIGAAARCAVRSGQNDVTLARPEPRPHRAHAHEHGRDRGGRLRRQAHRVGRRADPVARHAKSTCRRIFRRPPSSSLPRASARLRGLLIENVGVNPTRTGLLDDSAEMGAEIELRGERLARGRTRRGSSSCARASSRGIEVPQELVPLAIDEFPVLFVAAAAARGTTTVSGRRGAADEGKRPPRGDGHGLARAGRRASRSSAGGLACSGGPLRGGTRRQPRRPSHRNGVRGREPASPARRSTILNTAEVATSFPSFSTSPKRRAVTVETRRDAV